MYPRHQRHNLPLSHALSTAAAVWLHEGAAVAHASTLRSTPAAATVDPDEVRRSSEGTKLPPEPPTSERGAACVFVSGAQSAISLHREEKPGSGEAFARSRGCPGEEWREQKRKEIKKNAPAGLAWSILRVSATRSLWRIFPPFCPAASRPWVGHMGAPICPSASATASRHLTEARNKVEEVLLPYNWTLRGSSHSLQNRFPQRRRVRVRASSRFKAFFCI